MYLYNMWQSTCLDVYPIKIDSFAFLFNCNFRLFDGLDSGLRLFDGLNIELSYLYVGWGLMLSWAWPAVV